MTADVDPAKGKIIKLAAALPSITMDFGASLRHVLESGGIATGFDGVDSVWCKNCKGMRLVYTYQGHYLCTICHGLLGFPVPVDNPWNTPGAWLEDCSGFQVIPYCKAGETEVRYE